MDESSDVSTIELRNRIPISCHPIRPGDRAVPQRFRARLSAQPVYFRFFGAHPVLGDGQENASTEVDGVDQFALADHTRMLGLLRGLDMPERIVDEGGQARRLRAPRPRQRRPLPRRGFVEQGATTPCSTWWR
jgi:hypothetical protein